MRPSGRKLDEMRAVSIETGFTKHAEGSALIKIGHTHVLCTATIEDRVPPFIKGSGLGWVTAEYGMLPRATHTRPAPLRHPHTSSANYLFLTKCAHSSLALSPLRRHTILRLLTRLIDPPDAPRATEPSLGEEHRRDGRGAVNDRCCERGDHGCVARSRFQRTSPEPCTPLGGHRVGHAHSEQLLPHSRTAGLQNGEGLIERGCDLGYLSLAQLAVHAC